MADFLFPLVVTISQEEEKPGEVQGVKLNSI